MAEKRPGGASEVERRFRVGPHGDKAYAEWTTRNGFDLARVMRCRDLFYPGQSIEVQVVYQTAWEPAEEGGQRG